MGGSRGAETGGPDPLKNHKTRGYFNNPENQKAYVGPSSARQLNTILMVFQWRADDGPLIVSWTPLTKLSGSVHVLEDVHFLLFS